jgi:hypothetical protein
MTGISEEEKMICGRHWLTVAEDHGSLEAVVGGFGFTSSWVSVIGLVIELHIDSFGFG